MFVSSIKSGAINPVTVTLPIGNVAKLEAAWRITPERTERACLYLEKFGALPCADQRRVKAMEALLFGSAAKAGTCAVGDLYLPDACFNCKDGKIWYYYSSKRRKFMLADFRLHDHGSESGTDGMTDRVFCNGSRHYPGLAAGIAACLSGLLARGIADSGEVDTGEVIVDAGLGVRAAELNQSLVEVANHIVLIEIARGCWSLCHSGSDMALPGWSALAGATRVREELENPYARSIFAGEALCRLGEVICSNVGPDRSFLVDPTCIGAAGTHAGISVLQRESAAILTAIRDGDAGGLSGLRHGSNYLTSTLMDPTMFADARRLALVRSEMVLRLAMVLTREMGLGCMPAADCADRGYLRRYAMLSDFVRVSAMYFGASGRGCERDGATSKSGDHTTESFACTWTIFQAIEDFGLSMTLVVDQLDPDGHFGPKQDPASLHARLVMIATEIFGHSAAFE